MTIRLVGRFGVAHYIMAGLPSHGEDPESLNVVNKWPKEWLDRYRAENHFYADPVTQWSFSQPRPFTWQAARQNCDATARARQIEGEARELHLVDGIGFPVAGPNRFQATSPLPPTLPATCRRNTAGCCMRRRRRARSRQWRCCGRRTTYYRLFRT
jgi:hypothetical protein